MLLERQSKQFTPHNMPMPKETLLKYSCHSVRVWACVCLDEVGKQPDFIKKRLRWVGESYRVYLRDTNKINEQNRDALKVSLEATISWP